MSMINSKKKRCSSKKCRLCGRQLPQLQSDYCSWYCKIFGRPKWVFFSGLIIFYLAEVAFSYWWLSFTGVLLMVIPLFHHIYVRPMLNPTCDRFCPQCRVIIRQCTVDQDSCPYCGTEPLYYSSNLKM